MTLLTPVLHARGRFTVAAPFALQPNVLYECIAIRTFSDYVGAGLDAFSKFYEPMGISHERYEEDQAAGASICTFASSETELVYIPDSYITSLPILDQVAYSRIVLSVDLGALPDAVDLTFLRSTIAADVEAIIGKAAPVVNLHQAASKGVVTQAQHEALETARQAAITNQQTDRARLLATQEQLAATQAKVTLLEQILRDYGFLQ